MAQLVISAAGAAVGFYVGGPTGAQIGWAVGSMIGSSLNPKKVQGSRLQDLSVGSSQYGKPIPRVFGSPRVPGQMWWASEKRELSSTSGGGGKGGGPEVTSYSYEVDLLIGLCEGPITGVARIWSNGKLVYNQLQSASDETRIASARTSLWNRLEVYLGTASQLPDSVYETAQTAANAPAYRGRAYALLEALQLGSSGQLPNLTFEVIVKGTIGDPLVKLMTIFTDASPDDVSFNDTGPPTYLLPDNLSITNGQMSYVQKISEFAGLLYSDLSFQIQPAPLTVEFLCKVDPITPNPPSASVQLARFTPNTSATTNFWDLRLTGLTGGHNRIEITPPGGAFWTISPAIDRLSQLVHIAIVFRAGGTYDYYISGTRYTPGNNTNPVINIHGASLFMGGEGQSTQQTQNTYYGARISRVELYTEATITPPTTFDLLSDNAIVPGETTVQETVAALLDYCELDAARYDASGLGSITGLVGALSITQVSPTRATLDQLATAYFFETTLRDKLYFRPRAESPVADIPFTDLAAGADAPAAEPLALTVASDLELPPQVAVSYANLLDDHQQGAEYSDRIISGQAATQTIELAMGLTPAEAKGIADAIVVDTYASRTSTTIALPLTYARLEAGDVVTVRDEDNAAYRLRLVRKREESAVLQFEAVLDDQSALTSLQITDETQVPSGTVTTPGGTVFEALDIPILRDADDGPGYYVAAKGSTTTWPGAQIQSSINDVDFTTVAEVNENAVFGAATTTLATYTGVGFDERNAVTVNVGNGELSSSTRAAMLADETINAMLIGSEAIRFRDATLSSPGVYVLTGLLRGQRGTEWAIAAHAASEVAALLRPQGLRRVSTQSDQINQARYLRGVTLGTVASDASSESFTDTGVSLKPWAPVDLRVLQGVLGSAAITWKRRTRIATKFCGPSVINIPLGETQERYDLRILDGSSNIIRTEQLTTASYSYTAALQQADFGEVQTVFRVQVAQIGAQSIEGYSLTQTVTTGYNAQRQGNTIRVGGIFDAKGVASVTLFNEQVFYISAPADSSLVDFANGLRGHIDALTGYSAVVTGSPAVDIEVLGPLGVQYVLRVNASGNIALGELIELRQTAAAPQVGSAYQQNIFVQDGGGHFDAVFAVGAAFSFEIRRGGLRIGAVGYTTPEAQNTFQVLSGLIDELDADASLAQQGFYGYITQSGTVWALRLVGILPVANQQLTINGSSNVGSLFAITVSLGAESIPASRAQISIIWVAVNSLGGPIQSGYACSVILQGAAFNYTTVGGETESDLANSIAALIDADAAYTATAAAAPTGYSGYAITVTGALETAYTVESYARRITLEVL